MIIVILSFLLLYAVDSFFVGITFQALANKYQWEISPKKSFVILFFIFALLDNYILPLVYSLDLTITIGNEAIASFIDLPEDYPFIDFFELGLFEFITWSVQAVLAGLFGSKIIGIKATSEITNH